MEIYNNIKQPDIKNIKSHSKKIIIKIFRNIGAFEKI